MTKPPLNTYIEWDGSSKPPVPVGTEVTCWIGGGAIRTTISGMSFRGVTAYLVHSYPEEPEVVKDCWLEIEADRHSVL